MPLTSSGALAEIRRHSGAQFDPAVADALCIAAEELAAVRPEACLPPTTGGTEGGQLRR